MIYPYDFHIHSRFCDGKDDPETVVKSALQKGLKAIGFSSHSYTEFDKSYAMSPENTNKYLKEISRLKAEFSGKIKILCGIEKDFFSNQDLRPFDYCINSVHYVKKAGNYLDVDLSRAAIIKTVDKYYSGDFYDFIADYYDTVGQIDGGIIGHFDLVTIFNGDSLLFNENDKRYIHPALCACDKLIERNAVFEVNTGAIFRGYKNTPYPSELILRHIQKNGGRIMLSSDAHKADAICFKFDETADYLKTLGFNELFYPTTSGFNKVNF